MLGKVAELSISPSAALSLPERLARGAGTAAVPAALLVLSAALSLPAPGAGGSLLARLGSSDALVLLSWQVLLILVLFAGAGSIDLLTARSRRPHGLPPAVFALTWILVTLEAASWIMVRIAGVPMHRDHLEFLWLERCRIGTFTTRPQQMGLLALLILGALLAVALVRLGERLARASARALRPFLLALGGAAASALMGHLAI